MRRLVLVLVVVGVLAGFYAPHSAEADNDISGTGQWLLGLNDSARFYYIVGVTDGLGLSDSTLEVIFKSRGLDNAGRSLIFPKKRNLTYGQIEAITTKYLRDHPEQWGYPASSLVYQAIWHALDKMP